jgi:hypothetical protein
MPSVRQHIGAWLLAEAMGAAAQIRYARVQDLLCIIIDVGPTARACCEQWPEVVRRVMADRMLQGKPHWELALIAYGSDITNTALYNPAEPAAYAGVNVITVRAALCLAPPCLPQSRARWLGMRCAHEPSGHPTAERTPGDCICGSKRARHRARRALRASSPCCGTALDPASLLHMHVFRPFCAPCRSLRRARLTSSSSCPPRSRRGRSTPLTTSTRSWPRSTCSCARRPTAS